MFGCSPEMPARRWHASLKRLAKPVLVDSIRTSAASLTNGQDWMREEDMVQKQRPTPVLVFGGFLLDGGQPISKTRQVMPPYHTAVLPTANATAIDEKKRQGTFSVIGLPANEEHLRFWAAMIRVKSSSVQAADSVKVGFPRSNPTSSMASVLFSFWLAFGNPGHDRTSG